MSDYKIKANSIWYPRAQRKYLKYRLREGPLYQARFRPYWRRQSSAHWTAEKFVGLPRLELAAGKQKVSLWTAVSCTGACGRNWHQCRQEAFRYQCKEGLWKLVEAGGLQGTAHRVERPCENYCQGRPRLHICKEYVMSKQGYLRYVRLILHLNISVFHHINRLKVIFVTIRSHNLMELHFDWLIEIKNIYVKKRNSYF